MMGHENFLEGVKDLMRLSRTREGHLTRQEIRSFFSDMELSDQQLDFICSYLEGNDVIIDDWVKKEKEEIPADEDQGRPDPMDAEMVLIYKKEASKAKRLTPDQENQLIYRMLAGDENARNLLIEANLHLAIELADQYRGQGLPLSDLIQEANIGLMMAVNSFEPGIDGSFADYKERMIRKNIEEAVLEYSHSTRSAKKIASRINELNDTAEAFAREYEREASPRELAERMGITEEEVRELMKVSLDAIAILDQGKITG